MDAETNDRIDVDGFLRWAETCAWAALVITPIIWGLQGESVSVDQFVARCTIVAISAAIGLLLRARAIFVARRRRTKRP